MKKRGFTLAEVLITLAIIGTVASITLPNLTVNIRNQQTGPALAKAVNTLQLANNYAIQQGAVRNLTQLIEDNEASYFDEALKSYVQWQKSPIAKPYTKQDGTAFGDGITSTYTTPDGITFLREDSNTPEDSPNTANLTRAYSGKYYTVYVDINGNSKGPNIIGKDLFQFVVDTKGHVIPYGGTAYKDYMGTETILWETGCVKGQVHTDPASCTGSVADNSWKVIY